MDSVWYGKFIWVFFYNLTKVRKCGQHPGRMSRVGWGAVIFMSLVFFMFQSILNIFFCFFFVEKINHFQGWGVPPPPFTESSTEIIYSIFEPFPQLLIIFYNFSTRIGWTNSSQRSCDPVQRGEGWGGNTNNLI